MIASVRLLAASLGVFAGPARAQVPDITVTGTRPTPEAIRQHATDFVKATGVALGDLPAARWVDPVCPRVLGLADDYARIVEAKLREIATDAGIKVARAPCTPNIAVSFALDAGAVVQTIAAKSPKRLAEVPAAGVAALKNGTAPIRWWYSTEPRDRDGSPPVAGPPPWSTGNAEGGGSVIPTGDGISNILHYSSSLVGTGTIRALRLATVVVDINRTHGLPLASVASYAAMVALAEMRPGVAGGAGSVLGLFGGSGGGDPPRSPTAWDFAFLRAVYHLPLDRRAEQQRRMLVRDLVEAK